MSGFFSEFNKVNIAVAPKLQSSGTGAGPTSGEHDSDVLNLKNYKRIAFILSYGTCIASFDGKIRLFAGGTTDASNVATPIPFYYRSETVSGGTAATTDEHSAVTAATTAGFSITTGVDGMSYICETDAATVAAAGSTGGVPFHRVKLQFKHTTSASGPREWGCIAILSEPRYPQEILVSAID